MQSGHVDEVEGGHVDGQVTAFSYGAFEISLQDSDCAKVNFSPNEQRRHTQPARGGAGPLHLTLPWLWAPALSASPPVEPRPHTARPPKGGPRPDSVIVVRNRKIVLMGCG
ncbi:hypothetical protein Ade02nite_42410 [Paractinoplanes deccanensis]|uniref:Uncharacterized protein n=1 Tax=Paractinoplanes deccanensis TaxID=113561 RepID=A0ABQ3Y6T4_9ACTN|nr:hypothetical protein Ade02nite_42410 [Actinoplanes deccanensis]